jgi:large subunit ribosomal protein L10
MRRHDVAREDKVAEVAEVRDRLAGSVATLLTHYRGLSVKEMAQLRTELRDANAEMRVVKNTLAKRAVADAGIEGLDTLLEGPTSLVFCNEDPVGPAKALKKFAKDHPNLVIRGGYLDGAVMDAEETTRLADLASREELLAKMAGLMQGALAGFARLLQAQIVHQARLLQALIDDRVAKGETAPAPAVAEEPAAEAGEAPAEAPADEVAAEPVAESEAPADTEAPAETVGEADAEAATETTEEPAAEA